MFKIKWTRVILFCLNFKKYMYVINIFLLIHGSVNLSKTINHFNDRTTPETTTLTANTGETTTYWTTTTTSLPPGATEPIYDGTYPIEGPFSHLLAS